MRRILVGIKRVMFLYHYLTALVFALLVLGYIVEKFSKKPKRTYMMILAVSVLSFVYFAPLIYGLELKQESHQNRVWLRSWQ